MSIKELIPMFQTETMATLYMVGVSTLISYLIGIPLGVILIVTEDGGLYPIKPVHAVLGFLTNIFRTIPFLILLVMVLPITKFLVHTTLGPNAIIPPLVFAAAPYIARMVESSLKEVDAGVIEAARSMGANRLQIIWKVYLPEAKPSLYIGAAICITSILSYSAMAGRRRRAWSHCFKLRLLPLQDGHHDYCGFSTHYHRADYPGVLDASCKIQR